MDNYTTHYYFVLVGNCHVVVVVDVADSNYYMANVNSVEIRVALVENAADELLEVDEQALDENSNLMEFRVILVEKSADELALKLFEAAEQTSAA